MWGGTGGANHAADAAAAVDLTSHRQPAGSRGRPFPPPPRLQPAESMTQGIHPRPHLALILAAGWVATAVADPQVGSVTADRPAASIFQNRGDLGPFAIRQLQSARWAADPLAHADEIAAAIARGDAESRQRLAVALRRWIAGGPSDQPLWRIASQTLQRGAFDQTHAMLSRCDEALQLTLDETGGRFAEAEPNSAIARLRGECLSMPTTMRLLIERDYLDLLEHLNTASDAEALLAVWRHELGDTPAGGAADVWGERLMAIFDQDGSPPRTAAGWLRQRIARSGEDRDEPSVVSQLILEPASLIEPSVDAAAPDRLRRVGAAWSAAWRVGTDEQLAASESRLIEAARQTPPGEDRDGAVGLLIATGQIDEALALIVEPEEAAELAVAAGRATDGFERLGIPPDASPATLTKLTETALNAQVVHPVSRATGYLSKPMAALIGWVRQSIAVGRLPAARRVAEHLVVESAGRGDAAERVPFLLQYYVALAGLERWLPQLIAGPDDSSTQQDLLAERTYQLLTLVDGQFSQGSVAALDLAIEAIDPGASRSRRLRQLVDSLSGSPPPLIRDRSVELALEVVNLIRDESSPMLVGDPGEAATQIRDWLIRCELPAAAAALDPIAGVDDAVTLTPGRIGYPVFDTSGPDAVRWLGGPPGGSADQTPQPSISATLIEPLLAARRGEDSSALQTALRRVRLAGVGQQIQPRRELIDQLIEHRELALAIELTAQLVEDTAARSVAEADFLANSRLYLELVLDPDVVTAAPWVDGRWIDDAERWVGAALVMSLPGRSYPKRLTLAIAQSEITAMARRGVDRGVPASPPVPRRLTQAMRYDRLNIALGERLMPIYRDTDWQPAAAAVIEQIFAAGSAHVARFPNDASVANNVAWTAAVAHQRLDEALRLARGAVAKEPDSTIYRDTLAEILFLLGESEQALQIESACLIDDPGDWQLHQQVQRFGQ